MGVMVFGVIGLCMDTDWNFRTLGRVIEPCEIMYSRSFLSAIYTLNYLSNHRLIGSVLFLPSLEEIFAADWVLANIVTSSRRLHLLCNERGQLCINVSACSSP